MHKQDGRRKHLGWVEAALRAANPDLPLLKISAQSHDGPADHVAFVDVYGIDADSDRRRNIRSNANDLLFRLGYRVGLEPGRDVYDVTPIRPVSAHEGLGMLRELNAACRSSDANY